MPTRLREGQRPQASDEEAWLARRAAAGDGAAFTTLYDRYERRAYNLCYRITGSRDDAADATQETFVKVLERLPHLTGRELQFGPYLLRAARNASYDAIARQRRAVPAAEIHDSAVPVGSGDSDADRPERGALLEAHQEEIRAANETLPPRQREALALRELEELSYDEIAEIMGMNRNSVAQLLSRARVALRDGLRRTALGSIASASPDCERALPLLALRQDGALGHDAASADWLTRHLSACAICPARVAAMEEAGAVYRLWLPLVPALWLRGEAIAHAAEHVGADWSEPVSPRRGPSGDGAPRFRGARRRWSSGAAVVLVLLAVAEAADAPERSAPVVAHERASAVEPPAPAAVTHEAAATAEPRRPAKTPQARETPDATDHHGRRRAAERQETPAREPKGASPQSGQDDAPAPSPVAEQPPSAAPAVDAASPDPVDEPPGPSEPDDDATFEAPTCGEVADRPPPPVPGGPDGGSLCSDRPCPPDPASTPLPDRGDGRPPCSDPPCPAGAPGCPPRRPGASAASAAEQPHPARDIVARFDRIPE